MLRTLYVTRIAYVQCLSTYSRALGEQRNRSYAEKVLESEQANVAMVAVLTTVAFALRFFKINHPDQVVYVLAHACHHVPL